MIFWYGFIYDRLNGFRAEVNVLKQDIESSRVVFGQSDKLVLTFLSLC